MKDFLFVFRNDYKVLEQRSPEEMEASMKKWMDWMGNFAAQNKLIDRGNRLHGAGKVVNPGNVITDGPYAEIKELIGGYTLVRAESLDEAAEMAKNCPILEMGGNVEVREINPM